ncbi:MAG: nucleoside hydrolase [Candidatus Limnocylindrales bacterium]
MAARIPLILDCDPGHDDALAIVVALARPEARPAGHHDGGRQRGPGRDDAQRLSGADSRRPNRDPVAAGAVGPLLRSLHVAEDVHGASGLEGAALPEPACDVRPEGALELLRTTVLAASAPVVIAAVGPLTNIALLVRIYPEVLERIHSIRVMGGAITEGNATASAEFNIWQDPEAAHIVLECGRPITLMTLDATHQALFTEADVVRLEALGTQVATVFADLLRYFGQFHRRRYGWDGSPIHDALVVAHLAVPELVKVSRTA